jgi:hypothetical protein
VRESERRGGGQSDEEKQCAAARAAKLRDTTLMTQRPDWRCRICAKPTMALPLVQDWRRATAR